VKVAVEILGILARQIPSFIRQRKIDLLDRLKILTLVLLAVQHVIVPDGVVVQGVTLAHGVHLINRKIVKSFG
jgi:hypothetical protein